MPSWSSVAAGRRDVVGSADATASHPPEGSGGTVVSQCTTTRQTDTTIANADYAGAPTNPPATSPGSAAGSGPPPPSSFADALLNRSPSGVSRQGPRGGPIAGSVNDRPKTSAGAGSASMATAMATTTAGSPSPPPSSKTKGGKGREAVVEDATVGFIKHENGGTRGDSGAHRGRPQTASRPAAGPEGGVTAGCTSEARRVAKSSSYPSKVDGSAAKPVTRAPPQSAPPERPTGGKGAVARPPPSSSGEANSRTGVENGHNNNTRRSSPNAPGRIGGQRAAAAGGRGRGAVLVGNNKSAKKKGDYGHPLPPICHFYRQNRCRAGSRCRFRHSDDVDEGASTSVKSRRSGRAFCPIKGSAVRLALALQDAEPMTWREFDTLDDESGPFYGVDVECVATGYGHRDRAPARVAVVDWRGEVVLDEFVRFPEDNENNGDNNDGKGGWAHQKKVVSYLTPLTGLTREMCQRPENLTIDGVIEKVREVLPSEAILVGHGVQHDVDWLRLRRGVDYGDSVDTVAMFRRRVPPPSSLATFASRALAAYSSDGGAVDGIIGRDGDPRAVAVREASAAVLAAIEDAKVAREEAGAAVAIEAENENGESSTGGDRRADEEGDGDDADEDRRPANPEPQPQPTPPISPPPPPPPPMARYRIFSLRHVCLHLLGVDVQDGSHDPTVDARYSLKLFLKYRRSSPEMLRAARDALHRAPPTSGFAALHPVVDGVCLSRESYRYKHAARFIWRWWIGVRWKRA